MHKARDDYRDWTRLVASLLGKVPERTMRLFAVACSSRVEHLLTEHWRHGIEVAERFANGRATRDELALTLSSLTRDFEEVIESDNGEIHAAKEVVLACLAPGSPFDPTEAASKASKAVGCAQDSAHAQFEEQACQMDEFQAFLAEVG